MRVHNVVEGARGPGTHRAGRPRGARILRVHVEHLHQQGDTPVVDKRLDMFTPTNIYQLVGRYEYNLFNLWK